MNPWSLSYNFS